MKGFTITDLIILVIYLLAVLFAGLYFSKKDMKGKEFFRGDGTIPWWVTSVSIFATLLSPISFLSMVGNSYNGTWILWFAQLGMIVAIPLTIKFILPIYSKLDIDTAYQYLELRFGNKGLRVIGAFMFIIYQIGRMAIVMYLPSSVLANLTNIDVNILIIIMAAIAIIYSYTGGLKSVLWTDFIQGAVLLVGVAFTLAFIVLNLKGGVGDIATTLENGKFLSADNALIDMSLVKNSVFILIVGAGLNTFSSYISSQDVVQRFTTTTDTKKLNKMMYANGLLSIVVTLFLYFIGTGLFVFYNQNPALLQTAHQDQIFASFIAYQLPVGITGLLLAAIYAASQSTLSTGLNSVATSWTLDIQSIISKKQLSFETQTKIARYVSLGVGILAVLVAIMLANGNIKSAYETFNQFMGLVLGVLGGLFVLGVFYKRCTAVGAYVGFVVSAVAIIYIDKLKIVSLWSYALISIALSFAVGVIVSEIHRKIKDIQALPDERTYYK